MNNVKRGGCRWWLRVSGGVLVVLVAGVVVVSLIVNRRIPEPPDQLHTPSELDIARVEEALHLRAALGDEVWPGWAEQAAPLAVFNDKYAFLFGADAVPDGWEAQNGYYRSDQNREWQNFAEQLNNGVWAGALGTKTALDLFITEQVGGVVPDPVEPIVPIGLLLSSTDLYITGLLHESFHAYQAEVAPAKFRDVEQAYMVGDQYAAALDAMRNGWQEEARLLAAAVRADTDKEAADLARNWWSVRETRRADLPPELVAYEQRFEWLEGLAKYVELEIWEAAVHSPTYTPLPSLAADDRFNAYNTYQRRNRGEMSTLRTVVTQEGDGRFYYTGMAQARLLDRLLPGWKSQSFEDDVWLDRLLMQAVN